MVRLFRRFEKPLLIFITIVSALGMVVFYNSPIKQRGNGMQSDVALIYGRGVGQTELDRTARRLELMEALGQFETLMSLIGRVPQNQVQQAFVWNTIIIRHEAEALGIMSAHPGKPEQEKMAPMIAAMIKTLPAFQTNGGFDYGKYLKFVQEQLSPHGFNPSELDEVMADTVRLTKLKEVLGAGLSASPDEIREAFREQTQKTEVSVVRFKFEDFQAAAQVTDEELKKAFEERKESFKSPEKRKVRFVAFTLGSQAASLFGADRADALQKLSDQAQNFAVAMTDKEAKFEEQSAKSGGIAGETAAFTANEPPKELDANASAAAAAFALTKEQPNSDVISGQNGSYVLQLSDIEAAKPLTIEDAQGQLTEQLKGEKAREAMNLKASEVRTKIEGGLKGEKSFASAAEEAGTKAEKLPPFSQTEPLKDQPDAQEIMRSSVELAYGQISAFLPTPAGGLLIHLDRKLPVDEAAFQKEKATLAEEYTRGKGEALFQEWMRARYKAANVQALRT